MVASLVDLEKKIIALSERQLLIIQDFDQRYARFFREHNQGALQLISKAKQLVKSPNQEVAEEIRNLVGRIESQIISSLRFLSTEEGESSQAYELLVQENSADKSALQILEVDYTELRKNIGALPEGEVKEALLDFLDRLKKGKEASEQEQEINKRLVSLLAGLARTAQREQQLLENELSVLKQKYSVTLEELDEARKVELAEANISLEKIIQDLGNLLELERRQFIEPYKAFTNRKYEVTKKILALSQEKVITSKMIQADLKELAPLQAEEYLEQLLTHFSRLEDAALQYFLRFKNFFRRKTTVLKQRQEDETRVEMTLLRRKAQYDMTMGISTKNFFYESLNSHIRITTRMGGFISIMLFDLDLFKQINDTYGHPVGDKVLWTVGQVALASIRTGDIVSRLGGEEVGIIFGAGTSANEAGEAAERIRERIEKQCKERILDEPNPSAELKQLQDDLLEGKRVITASGGVATIELPKIDATSNDGEKLVRAVTAQLYAAADKMLYNAKHAGRNMVIPVEITYQLE